MMTTLEVLSLPLPPNDSGATTIKGYLVALLAQIWREGEGFSGERPFGNSGWESDLFAALVRAGAITGTLDEAGYVDDFDRAEGERLISEAILSL